MERIRQICTASLPHKPEYDSIFPDNYISHTPWPTKSCRLPFSEKTYINREAHPSGRWNTGPQLQQCCYWPWSRGTYDLVSYCSRITAEWKISVTWVLSLRSVWCGIISWYHLPTSVNFHITIHLQRVSFALRLDPVFPIPFRVIWFKNMLARFSRIYRKIAKSHLIIFKEGDQI